MTVDTRLTFASFAKGHYDHGWERGWKRGWKQGWGQGRREGTAKAIVIILEARGLDVSETERDRISKCTDLRVLNKWIRCAATTENTNDLFSRIALAATLRDEPALSPAGG
jgi:hypothetical protein